MSGDNYDPTPLTEVTGFDTFDVERDCATCSADACPGKQLDDSTATPTPPVDEYPCFVKAQFLANHSLPHVRQLLANNNLIRYVGLKTQAVTRDSTARGAYGNLGTLTILLEDFLTHHSEYDSYDGLEYQAYLSRVRTIPGCSKLQNHAINHRLNEDYKKHFRHEETTGPVDRIPIPGRQGTTYKLNTALLESLSESPVTPYDVAQTLVSTLRLYFYFREMGDQAVLDRCATLRETPLESEGAIHTFFEQTLREDDSRIFEIAAFVVLKGWYATQSVYLGDSKSEVSAHSLTLHKTGRVSANDGGIDYVLQPLGRFFQATQSVEFGKYFLDIEKLSQFPLTFIVQTDQSATEILTQIRADARSQYDDEQTRERYLSAVEEIFTLPDLERMLADCADLPDTQKTTLYRMMLDEYSRHYAVEYNLDT